MTTVTLHGNEVNLEGTLPEIGSAAPDFELVDRDLNVATLGTFGDARKLLSILPSIDTPVCAKSSVQFNQEAQKLDDKSVVLVISSDLPFAMTRFCADQGTDRLVTLSMMRNRDFARDYGVLIAEGPLAGITARAVVVLDSNNQVLYTELVPEIGDEPNYAEAMAALQG